MCFSVGRPFFEGQGWLACEVGRLCYCRKTALVWTRQLGAAGAEAGDAGSVRAKWGKRVKFLTWKKHRSTETQREMITYSQALLNWQFFSLCEILEEKYLEKGKRVSKWVCEESNSKAPNDCMCKWVTNGIGCCCCLYVGIL